MSTVQQRNARSVVVTWRNSGHRHAWGPQAANDLPSTLMSHAAIEYQQVSQDADAAADRLAAVGFLPGHSDLRRLRDVASSVAGDARRLDEWARLLAEAEAEPTP